MKTPIHTYIYTFQDMKIYTVNDGKTMTVYKQNEEEENLEFLFSVLSEKAGEVDIEALHENGYFDD